MTRQYGDLILSTINLRNGKVLDYMIMPPPDMRDNVFIPFSEMTYKNGIIVIGADHRYSNQEDYYIVEFDTSLKSLRYIKIEDPGEDRFTVRWAEKRADGHYDVIMSHTDLETFHNLEYFKIDTSGRILKRRPWQFPDQISLISGQVYTIDKEENGDF